ncbi:RNA polymerase sigma factor [Rhodococcus pyridinivorans]|uniref:RNA polymerase sigma factor n=1 Tax=Rhodococcus pyridinivorans TaxID=103816 RepID=UPI0039B50F4E
MGEPAATVEAVFREEHGRLLATLVHRFGDLDLAEEVASDALEAALVHWPVDGVPERPGAWLLTTARRKALDRVRRDRVYAARLAELAVDTERGAGRETPPSGDLPDDRLELFFTCAHPALAPDDRIALILRCLGGLTTNEVARAFLVPPSTMAQRIVRAKTKIRGARIPFRVPRLEELPERLPVVLAALYSIFTEGYAASSGEHLQRTDLAEESIRLTRILHRLMPTEREVSGLLALMLLVHARRATRTDASGAVMLLDVQDRTRWDRAMIDEGSALVVAALTGGPPGPYALQAAIAALHDEASDLDSTDWPQIVALYDLLSIVGPSPIVALNRAVAIAMRDGPDRGLELLDTLAGEPSLRNYGPYAVARAELLSRAGRKDDAAAAYRRALDLAGTEAERRHLRSKLPEPHP